MVQGWCWLEHRERLRMIFRRRAVIPRVCRLGGTSCQLLWDSSGVKLAWKLFRCVMRKFKVHCQVVELDMDSFFRKKKRVIVVVNKVEQHWDVPGGSAWINGKFW